jgi:hypothetical protein
MKKEPAARFMAMDASQSPQHQRDQQSKPLFGTRAETFVSTSAIESAEETS